MAKHSLYREGKRLSTHSTDVNALQAALADYERTKGKTYRIDPPGIDYDFSKLLTPVVLPKPTEPKPTDPVVSKPGKKWNPGHYLGANAFGFPKNDYGRREVYDLAKDQLFKGGVMRLTWGMLEQEQGKYDFSQIDKDVAYVKSIGKKLILELWWEGYKLERQGDFSDVRYFPDYIIARPDSIKLSGGYYSINLDDPWLMDRFIALTGALAARYDKEPTVEMLAINETAHERGIEWPRAIPIIAKQWPTTNVVLYMNWIESPELASEVMAILAANKIGVGGPDTLPPESEGGRYSEDMGSRALRGAGVDAIFQDGPQHGSGDFGSVDYRGRVPIAYGYQAIHNIPPATLIKYQMNTLKVTHSIWAVDHEQTQELNFYDGVLPAVKSVSGRTVTTNPYP
jgi:hypothetical protein